MTDGIVNDRNEGQVLINTVILRVGTSNIHSKTQSAQSQHFSSQRDKMAPDKTFSSRSSQLRQRAVDFTTAFVDVTKGLVSPQDFLASQFSSDPRITEHGPAWAQSVVPIFDKTYRGHEDCTEYFEILGGAFTCHFTDGSFPGPKEVVVDTESEGPDDEAGKARGVVWLSGHGTVSYTHLTLPTKRIV